ncbi:MAG: hypothetical protein N4A41_09550 [Crocinitomicaceae bacterium]|jgi:hypothetical protein|nr:hypothetical protein [Crocinitomicaceae bacterium]
MKKLQLLFAAFSMCFLALTSFAQEEEKKDSLLILTRPFPTGEWKADFTWAMISENGAKFSNLIVCNDMKSRGEKFVPGIYFVFGENLLTIKRCGSTLSVPYTKDDGTHEFHFTYLEEEFTFQMWYTEDSIILMDENQSLIVLRETKK